MFTQFKLLDNKHLVEYRFEVTDFLVSVVLVEFDRPEIFFSSFSVKPQKKRKQKTIERKTKEIS